MSKWGGVYDFYGCPGGEVLMAVGGTEIEVSKINLEYVLCEKEKS